VSLRKCLVAYDVCGCTGWVAVLGYGEDSDAYREAARHAKKGFRIEMPLVDDWKKGDWHCADHPDGPPWWKSNGGNGRRPVEYAPQQVAGL
jgi:hypothetical protein